MNINATNSINLSSVTYGSNAVKTLHATKENRHFADSFRNMMKSPVYGDSVIDTDEVAFRSGIEDFQSDTMLRTFQNNVDNMDREFAKSSKTSKKAKPARITTPAQAQNVEKFIGELEFLKLSNPQEAFSIGGQISRLKQMLKRYYKSVGHSVKL